MTLHLRDDLNGLDLVKIDDKVNMGNGVILQRTPTGWIEWDNGHGTLCSEQEAEKFLTKEWQRSLFP